MKSEINALQRENSVIYPFMKADRCNAKTRKGTVCKSPAVRKPRKSTKCRMHGGTNRGAPTGNCYALKNGFTTKEAKQLKKSVKKLLNEWT